MSIAKAGIKSLLPENIKLLSGPGCPVCVTTCGVIDSILTLSENENIIIATYGDMLRVPGSKKGSSLALKKAEGAGIKTVYSPTDAIRLAKENPEKEVVFLGVGFETTTPGTAAAVLSAKEENIKNFSVLCMLKRVEPALRALIESEDFKVNGFLCPGHVAVITGERGFEFLCSEYKIPSVIAGFEPDEIIKAITMLLRQIENKEAGLENAYKSVVSYEGNLIAKEVVKRCMEPCDSNWRGLGNIPESGLVLKKEYEEFDAAKKFKIDFKEPEEESACRCGDVICGRISPEECPMFGTLCTPEEPEGPCMVSTEGACAAAYNYRRNS